MPPFRRKIYIPLSLGHLIYTAGDKCMRQNACYINGQETKYFPVGIGITLLEYSL